MLAHLVTTARGRQETYSSATLANRLVVLPGISLQINCNEITELLTYYNSHLNVWMSIDQKVKFSTIASFFLRVFRKTRFI